MHSHSRLQTKEDSAVLIEVVTAPTLTGTSHTAIGYRLCGVAHVDTRAPHLLIAGMGVAVDHVLDFLSEMPGLSNLQGSLYLLKLDMLDGVEASENALFPDVSRFTQIFFLPESIPPEGENAPTTQEMTRRSCWSALRFCLSSGAFGQAEPHATYLH